jgi:DNA-binding transcriptional LysR family regulator
MIQSMLTVSSQPKNAPVQAADQSSFGDEYAANISNRHIARNSIQSSLPIRTPHSWQAADPGRLSRESAEHYEPGYEGIPFMDLLHALGTFVRVVETGSFSAVARETDSSNSSVTRLIGRLEDHFGIRLLHRTTRHLGLTDDGESLLAQARGMLEAAEQMEATLGRRKASPTGRVRVGLPPGMAILVTSRLSSLFRHYPGLSVDLVIGERFGDLIEERLDLVVQNGRSEHASAVVRAIATFSRAVVATPAYLEEHGVPQDPEALAHHSCIVHETGPDSNRWSFTGPTGPVDVRVAGPLHASSATMVHRAALAGSGIACLLEPHVLDDIRAGRLCRLLPKCTSERERIFVMYPSRRHVPPRTRVLIDFFVSLGREAEAQFANTRASVGDEHASRVGAPIAA